MNEWTNLLRRYDLLNFEDTKIDLDDAQNMSENYTFATYICLLYV